ncbi:MAG TPA: metallophosphoesterase [Thermoanaerobaculia bacterium]|nr:metallophosphoesterase [Thermoanaerobaculia bacterium]
MSKFREKRSLRVVSGGGARPEVRIAHISDLHFTSNTNPNEAIWQALRQDLEDEARRPDVIVATGDLVDNPGREWFGRGSERALNAVREYLHSLCKAARIDPADRLVAIPGNHDYRTRGNVASDYLERMFRSVFKNEFEHRLYPDLRLLILAFDSNSCDSNFDLATGAVADEDLLDIADFEKQDAQNWGVATKLALLHHHPMPIAATEGLKKLTEVESFLLLRNAARFMTKMVDERIDLVLHGHRHCPSFSRATYTAGKDVEHTIAVVSAGSVHHDDLHDRSYNLVTISDGGEIRVERRSLSGNDYVHEREWMVRDYRQARELLYARLLGASKGRLHVQRYSSHEHIQRDSGDVVSIERFEGVTSRIDTAVDGFRYTASTTSGYVGKIEYESEKINFFTAPPTRNPDGSREIATRVEPSIAKTPVTYTSMLRVVNAMYFSRRDRLDATQNTTSEESVRNSTSHAYDAMHLSVTFPPEHFPKALRMAVRGPDGKPALWEREFVAPHLTVIPAVHTVSFSVEKPLPNYEYAIVWDLPPDVELKLGAKEAGEADEILDQFNAQKAAGLLLQLENAFSPAVIADLFVYDDRVGGQRLVDTSDPNPQDLKERIIRSGVGPVGRAYRRRAVIVAAPVAAVEDVPESELADEVDPFSARTRSMIAVPLYYPLYTGRRIGTVVLRTAARSAPLHIIYDDHVLRFAVHDLVQSWFLDAIQKMANIAVDISSLPDVPAGKVCDFVEETEISDIGRSCRVKRHKPLSGTIAEIVQRLK